jgi:tetratricopeptide (TPR) repeat protein
LVCNRAYRQSHLRAGQLQECPGPEFSTRAEVLDKEAETLHFRPVLSTQRGKLPMVRAVLSEAGTVPRGGHQAGGKALPARAGAPAAAKAQSAHGEAAKTRVFISYSRRNMAFVDRLETALKERGFEPLVDRAEIYAFEDWWKRIQSLIEKCDTVVFALSPDSVASEVCAKEVGHASALNKRFAPIVVQRVDDKLVPEALGRLNFIFFDDEAKFAASFERLCDALATDIGWIRKHTEYGEATRQWTAAGRLGGLLLRSPMLEDAERWIAARPANAPAPTEETQTFIAESRRGATRRRNLLTGSLAAGLVLALVLAGFAYWQRNVAIQQRQYAEKALDASIATSNSVALQLARQLRTRQVPSSLVKTLLGQALELEDKITGLGRTTPGLLDGQASALLESAKTRRTIGDIAGALADAQRSRQLFEQALALEPNDNNAHLDIGLSYELMGDMLASQGKLDEALNAYQTALAKTKAAADANPKRAGLQDTIAIDYVHIGDLMQEQGKSADALSAFQTSLDIRQKLVAQDPTNAALLRGLGISTERVAQMQLAQGKLDDAGALFQKRLAIAQRLVQNDPGDTELQRELALSYYKVGEIDLQAKKYDDANNAFQNGLKIRQTLVSSDENNTQWQRDVAISYNMLGTLAAAQGKAGDALAEFQKGYAIEQKLAAADPRNIEFQRDIAISDSHIGPLLKQMDNLDGAQQALGDCLTVAQRLVQAEPNAKGWARHQQYCSVQMAWVGFHFLIAKQFAKALAAAEQAIAGAPELTWEQIHRAHALMFLGRTDEARAIYNSNRGNKNVFDNPSNVMSWDQFVLSEFDDIRKAGLKSPLMDEIAREFAGGG